MATKVKPRKRKHPTKKELERDRKFKADWMAAGCPDFFRGQNMTGEITGRWREQLERKP
jgi:hypothetical protein